MTTNREQAVQHLANVMDIPPDLLAADKGLNHYAQATCPHPAKERTSYGVCRLCKQKVSR